MNENSDFNTFLDALISGMVDEPHVTAAKELRRFYDALINVGFAEYEAFELLREMLRGGVKSNPS
ncbi:hypothetical protein [Nonomuraea sp. NPDC049141]|uniref:hypothetical protein n=1 Tax=Nonomuraea sp. NPDC049141 TaxID=3155500 RepID=UPI0033F3934F